jgi:hypothetical protein
VLLEEALVDERDVRADPLLELVLGGLARQQGPDQAVEVGSGGEVAAGAGEDADPDAVVAVDEVPGVAQATEDLGVEGVLLVGPVERDRDDRAVTFHQDRRF